MNNSLVLPKVLESTTSVRFQDCDPFRHLNNARYIDYFLNAREDHLKEFYNFSIVDHTQQTNQGWVVSKTQIAYLFPASLAETVLIQTRLIHMSDTTIIVEGVMYDQEMKRPKAVLWMEFVYVSILTGRPTRHSEDLMTFFASVCDTEIYVPEGFNQRVDAIKAIAQTTRRMTVALPTSEAV
jgi:YbgC/YbaW family acyl-CoA thioester hydrolase